jgi:hypothetical protein
VQEYENIALEVAHGTGTTFNIGLGRKVQPHGRILCSLDNAWGDARWVDGEAAMEKMFCENFVLV